MTGSHWSPELVATVDQVFRVRSSDELIVDVVPAGTAPRREWQVVERYFAWPSASHARYLVPADAPRAARTLLTGYGHLRSARSQAVRSAVAAAARGPLRGEQLHVVQRIDAPEDARLSTWMACVLNAPETRIGIPVRSLDPHSKPTVQVVSPSGETLGFTKLGATPSARTRVADEERGYGLLASNTSSRVQVPTVMHAAEWYGRRTLTTTPLPLRARLIGAAAYQESFAALLALGRSSWQVASLGESPTGRELVRRSERLLSHNTPHSNDLAAAVQTVMKTDGETKLVHGVLHGDWVPWNLAVAGRDLWAWDLEHSRASAPLGLDVVLGMIQQQAHDGSRSTIAGATLSTEPAARQVLSTLGLGATAIETTLRVGRLEVALRAAELWDMTRGWQAGLDDVGFRALLEPMRACRSAQSTVLRRAK